MRRTIPVFLLVALAALYLTPAAKALGSAPHDRPAGIEASAWVPINRDLAAVVEDPPQDLAARNRQLPSALGYLAVWRNGRWLRLDSLLLQPPSLRSPPMASVWMPIDRNLAFVIERQSSAQPMRGEAAVQSALGYFVVKRGGQWLRLDPVAQAALFSGPLRARPTGNWNWVPVGKSLRFVIEQQPGERYVAPNEDGQLPSVLGYFMGKRGNRWLRLGSIA